MKQIADKLASAMMLVATKVTCGVALGCGSWGIYEACLAMYMRPVVHRGLYWAHMESADITCKLWEKKFAQMLA